PHALRIGISSLVQDLERNFATKARIPGAIDLAHASAAERRADFIRRESLGVTAHAGLHTRPRGCDCISRVSRPRSHAIFIPGCVGGTALGNMCAPPSVCAARMKAAILSR